MTQLDPAAQAFPHPPQFASSLAVSVQYAAPLPLVHAVSPAPSQVLAHAPAEQTWLIVQVVPHAPQLALSVVVLAQYASPLADLHIFSVAAQLVVQRPAEHASPAAQALPHAPQFALSVCVLVQLPEHVVCEDAHAAASEVTMVDPLPLAQPTQTAVVTATDVRTAKRLEREGREVMNERRYQAALDRSTFALDRDHQRWTHLRARRMLAAA